MNQKTDLRLFRKANGITQGALAEYLGVTKQFISQVESGKNALPEDKLMKIIDNPEWSMEKYLQLLDTIEEINRAHEKREGKVVAGETADPTITLGMGHSSAGHRTTAIYIKRNRQKVDDANRLVIDWLWGKVTAPDLTTRDGRN